MSLVALCLVKLSYGKVWQVSYVVFGCVSFRLVWFSSVVAGELSCVTLN